ncbi:MAG: hypothetical protein Q9222_006923 [Ikaeria aurantiellina]
MAKSESQIERAQAALLFVTPAVVFLYFISGLLISICTLQDRRNRYQSRLRRSTLWCLYFILTSYVTQNGLLLVDSLSTASHISTAAANINAVSSALVWSTLTILLHKSTAPVWYPYLGSIAITLLLEVTTFGLFTSHNAIHGAAIYALLATQICRYLALLALLAIHASIHVRSLPQGTDEESAPLLVQHDTTSSATKVGEYGSVPPGSEDSDSEDIYDKEAKAKQQLIEDRLQKDGNWFTYLRGFAIFIPMIWPSKQPRLYFNMFGCILCVLCGRVLNILMPRQLGIIVTILTTGSGSLYSAIGVYVLLGWAASGAGISMFQDYWWVALERYSNTRIKTAAYNHMMELSTEFHDNKRTGELYEAIYQGSSISDLLEIFFFKFGPTIFDGVIGFGYLYHLFGPYMALLGAATMLAYWSSMISFNQTQARRRRPYVNLVRKEYQMMYDTLGSWATVNYFNRITHEEQRYQDAVTRTFATYRHYFLMANLYRMVGAWIMEFGFFGALLLGAYQVLSERKTVGDFVTLLSYWSIFTGPLAWFASAHKKLLQHLVDAEQLLRLFQDERKIKDGAQKFIMKGGAIDFNDVSFSYDGSKSIIKGLNLTVRPGQNVALVGETGGGKSTILKLLFRSYDVTEGSVIIDGQNVRDVTVASLRSYIGVVPQDPSMFNDTVMNNVRYSRAEATDEEVVEACKAAAVHDKIISFTDGYRSKVGEKGVKLSGGELQRLAIARAILKDPAIILLDEATSSVDTDTESRIQSALEKLTKGRTTFTVAHRLSTVMNSDIIVVIKDGQILEQGPPKSLLAAKGKYYDLWCKQVGVTPKTSTEMEGKPIDVSHASSGSDQAQPGLSEHKKIWRPDAPEFVPRGLRNKASSETQPSQENGQVGHATGAHHTKQQGLLGKITSSKGVSQGKRQRARDAVNKTMAALSTDSNIDDAADDNTGQVADIAEEEVGVNHKRARIGRAQRRNMSKSEPTASSTSVGDENNDTGDWITVPEKRLPNQNRRVSAPGQASSAVGGEVAGRGRRNRRKHWRVQNQRSSDLQSSSNAHQSSEGWDVESTMPTPSAPTTTPENVPRDISKGGNQNKATVHFAQDP